MPWVQLPACHMGVGLIIKLASGNWDMHCSNTLCTPAAAAAAAAVRLGSNKQDMHCCSSSRPQWQQDAAAWSQSGSQSRADALGMGGAGRAPWGS